LSHGFDGKRSSGQLPGRFAEALSKSRIFDQLSDALGHSFHVVSLD